LLYIGRLRVEKGIFSLVSLLRGSKINLTIITSEKGNKLKGEYKNIKHISFENYNDAIIKIYDEHSIFILPSYTEAHPQVLDEALARTRPVIVFKDIEHVKRQREGVFVCERNLKSLQDTIKYINNNYELIVSKIKKNKLPTKILFINELKKIILN
jgi:glycosyltransferase involved in cell wall biosynthesis